MSEALGLTTATSATAARERFRTNAKRYGGAAAAEAEALLRHEVAGLYY